MHWTRSMHSANYGPWDVAFCLYAQSLHCVAWLHVYKTFFWSLGIPCVLLTQWMPFPVNTTDTFSFILISENRKQNHFANGPNLLFCSKSILSLLDWKRHLGWKGRDLRCFHHSTSQKSHRSSTTYCPQLIVTIEVQLFAQLYSTFLLID